MLFSSTEFLYYFLPITLIFYFTVRGRGKNIVLLFFSLFFYFLGEPKYIFIMLISILSSFLFGFWIDKAKNKKIPLALSLTVSVSFLLYFKYTNFFIENINSLFGSGFDTLKIILPIGISFYTFQAMSYSIDLYRNDAKLQTNIIDFALYISLFPQLIAGPIVRYSVIEEQLKNRTHSIQKFSDGVFKFCVGLGKKVLIANVLGEFVEFYNKSNEQTVAFAWAYAIAFSMQIYFDFSGYSDMAIGLGRMFGFEFPENFNYPFISKSATEFWRRWHISLGSWFRDYVYIPMGGNRVKPLKWVLNIAVVWFLTGFWHGAQWNFIIWGLFFAVFLMLEKVFLSSLLNKLPKFISHIYLLFIVLISFVIFSGESNQIFISNITNMFGAVELINYETIYYLKSYAVIFIIAIISATPLMKNLFTKLTAGKGGKLEGNLKAIFVAVILLVSTAFLIEGSFNPFLYFRF